MSAIFKIGQFELVPLNEIHLYQLLWPVWGHLVYAGSYLTFDYQQQFSLHQQNHFIKNVKTQTQIHKNDFSFYDTWLCNRVTCVGGTTSTTNLIIMTYHFNLNASRSPVDTGLLPWARWLWNLWGAMSHCPRCRCAECEEQDNEGTSASLLASGNCHPLWTASAGQESLGRRGGRRYHEEVNNPTLDLCEHLEYRFKTTKMAPP